MPVKKMGRLVEQARSRIARWLAGDPTLTQKVLARAVQHEQGWVSKYLSGRQDADVDELDAMARALGHTLNELFDLRESPKERELVDAYRSIPADTRDLAIQVMVKLIPPPARRKGTRGRTGER